MSHTLKLELFWGDHRVDVRLVDRPRELRSFGIRSVVPIDGGFRLDHRRVAHGESARFAAPGALTCVATAVRPEPATSSRRLGELPWLPAALGLASLAMALAFGIHHRPAASSPRALATRYARFLLPRREPPRLGQEPARRAPRVWQLPSAGNSRGPAALPPPTGLDPRPFPPKVWPPLDPPPRAGKQSPTGTAARRGARPPRTFDATLVYEMAFRHRAELAACGKDSPVGATVTVEWHVTPAGAVIGAHVTGDTVEDPRVRECVLREVSRWRFPELTWAATVTFPFSLGSY